MGHEEDLKCSPVCQLALDAENPTSFTSALLDYFSCLFHMPGSGCSVVNQSKSTCMFDCCSTVMQESRDPGKSLLLSFYLIIVASKME